MSNFLFAHTHTRPTSKDQSNKLFLHPADDDAVSIVHKTSCMPSLHMLVIIRCHMQPAISHHHQRLVLISYSQCEFLWMKTHVPWCNPKTQDCGMLHALLWYPWGIETVIGRPSFRAWLIQSWSLRLLPYRLFMHRVNCWYCYPPAAFLSWS